MLEKKNNQEYLPLRAEVPNLIKVAPSSVLKKKKIEDKILSKILGFVDTFVNGEIGE